MKIFDLLWAVFKLLVKTVGIVAAFGWLGYQLGLLIGMGFPWLLIPIITGMAVGGLIALNLR